MSGGQVITGGVVSTTVTLKWQTLALSLASNAAQCTTVGPGGNKLPEDGEQKTVGFGQLSVATGVNTTGVPLGLLHSTVISCGQVMLGGWLSTITTVKVHLPTLPQASLLKQVTVLLPTG